MFRMRRARGFLLIDIMVGGAIAAVVIAGMLTLLVSARNKNVVATRDAVATQLVLERIDKERSRPFTSLATGTAVEAVVAGQTGKYRRETTIGGALTESVGSFSLPFRDITVVVTYNTVEGPTRRSQASTRYYQ